MSGKQQRRINDLIWAGVGIVILGYVLIAFVKLFIPVLVVFVLLTFVYRLMFGQKRW